MACTVSTQRARRVDLRSIPDIAAQACKGGRAIPVSRKGSVLPHSDSDPHRPPEKGHLIMAKVSPYHSSNPSDPDVYHDHDDCPTGQQIPARNRVAGTGGNRHCKQCTDLG